MEFLNGAAAAYTELAQSMDINPAYAFSIGGFLFACWLLMIKRGVSAVIGWFRITDDKLSPIAREIVEKLRRLKDWDEDAFDYYMIRQGVIRIYPYSRESPVRITSSASWNSPQLERREERLICRLAKKILAERRAKFKAEETELMLAAIRQNSKGV